MSGVARSTGHDKAAPKDEEIALRLALVRLAKRSGR